MTSLWFVLSYLFQLSLFQCLSNPIQAAFVVLKHPTSSYNRPHLHEKRRCVLVASSKRSSPLDSSKKSEKFSSAQRFESIKSGIVGLIAGGFALAPLTAIHNLVFPIVDGMNTVAQFEYDNDSGSLQGGLFAIVYRYCVREGEKEENEMLAMGVLGAFVAVRTLSRLRIPMYCSSIPLDCGPPLGYFDWNLLSQLALNGLESVALFGATSAAMEYCYSRGIISRFK